MIRVAALTSGRDVPSSRLRIRQFIAPLEERGVAVREHRPLVGKYAPPPSRAVRVPWAAAKFLSRLPGVLGARRGDVAWIERELLAGRFTLERFTPRRTLLDVGDAIWLQGRAGYSERIARRCFGVIAGNAFIAEHYRTFAPNVWVVPTSVDTEIWRPRARPAGLWTVGWIGTAGNLEYLLDIEDPLADFLEARRDAELVVVADKAPAFRRLPAKRWRFVRWSAAAEAEVVAGFRVGLMPLPRTDWALGKCAAKLLFYMASGVPALVTPVGVNETILGQASVGLAASDPAGWADGLRRFYEEPVFAEACGAAGRQLVLESYSLPAAADALAKIFRETASA